MDWVCMALSGGRDQQIHCFFVGACSFSNLIGHYNVEVCLYRTIIIISRVVRPRRDTEQILGIQRSGGIGFEHT